MFRSMPSKVSAISGFVAKRHQTVHHVSCSPSKIPYGGFSPVRLQTGLPRRPSRPFPQVKRKTRIPQGSRRLYAAKAPIFSPYGSFDHVWRGINQDTQSRGPWLTNRLCCPVGSSLTTASSVPLPPFPRLIFFVRWILALRSCLGWRGEVPQFTPRFFSNVPSPVPRRTGRVLMTIHPPVPYKPSPSLHWVGIRIAPIVGSQGDSVTRLQSSLYVTARWIACPSPTRTCTIELSPPEVTPRKRRL
jgi:hypothetical protein